MASWQLLSGVTGTRWVRSCSRLSRVGWLRWCRSSQGPKGPNKVTREMLSVIVEHADLPLPGLIAEVEARTRLRLSRSHVNRLRRRVRKVGAEQLELTTGLVAGTGSEAELGEPPPA